MELAIDRGTAWCGILRYHDIINKKKYMHIHEHFLQWIFTNNFPLQVSFRHELCNGIKCPCQNIHHLEWQKDLCESMAAVWKHNVVSMVEAGSAGPSSVSDYFKGLDKTVRELIIGLMWYLLTLNSHWISQPLHRWVFKGLAACNYYINGWIEKATVFKLLNCLSTYLLLAL